MKYEEIRKEWEKDSPIDEIQLDKESLNIPKLHAKYLDYLLKEKRVLDKVFHRYYIELKERREYYSGRATPDVYKEEPLELKILKTDIPEYLNADKKIQEIQEMINKQKVKVEYLEGVLDQIRQRNWNIKNAIEWKRFTMGE